MVCRLAVDFVRTNARFQDRWYTPYNSQHHADSENAVDVTIDLAGERPNTALQLKILIAGVESKYNIEKSKPEERTIRQILNQKM